MNKTLLCLSVWALTLGQAFSQNLRIIQMSDPQLGFREENGMEEGVALLEKAVCCINSLMPDVLVVTGDMVNSHSDTTQYRKYRELISGVSDSVTVFHLPGNHDVGKFSEGNRAAYLSRYGYTHFVWTTADVALVGMDSNPIKYTDVRAAREEYLWLKKALRKVSRCRHKFVFMHHPVFLKSPNEEEKWYNWSLQYRDSFLALFKKYGVEAVFSGHLHQSSHTVWSGIEMYTCSASGKTLGDGVSSLNLVEVSGDGFSCRSLGLDGF
ncbi:MAG: metallophosphoesterase family protein [Candidatus Cryptobacteroides sp.]